MRTFFMVPLLFLLCCIGWVASLERPSLLMEHNNSPRGLQHGERHYREHRHEEHDHDEHRHGGYGHGRARLAEELRIGELFGGLKDKMLFAKKMLAEKIIDAKIRAGKLRTEIQEFINFYYQLLITGLLSQEKTEPAIITSDNDILKIVLDVHQFKPEEINVRVVNRTIILLAIHEEKMGTKDQKDKMEQNDEKEKEEKIRNWIVLIRCFFVSENVDLNEIKVTISSDRVLTITAPIEDKPVSENKEIVAIPIEQTGTLTNSNTENLAMTNENSTISKK